VISANFYTLPPAVDKTPFDLDIGRGGEYEAKIEEVREKKKKFVVPTQSHTQKKPDWTGGGRVVGAILGTFVEVCRPAKAIRTNGTERGERWDPYGLRGIERGNRETAPSMQLLTWGGLWCDREVLG